jgi:hypothetical protein
VARLRDFVQSMIPKSGIRLSEKILLKQEAGVDPNVQLAALRLLEPFRQYGHVR